MTIEGLIAAPHTPFRHRGMLQVDVVPQQVAHLVEQGVRGAFVGGSTGECVSLTMPERKALCESWVDARQGTDLHLIVHVGSCCQRDAVELARHAAASGADAVAAFAPFYFQPPHAAALIDFFQPIVSACEPLPFYFYDIPLLTGVELPLWEILDRAHEALPRFAGVKYTNSNLVQLQECLQRFAGRFEFLFGCDEMLLAGLSLGIRGAVGSTYNFAAPLYLAMMDAFRTGEMEIARKHQAKAVEMINAVARFGFMSGAKHVMSLIGVDCGPPRPPLPTLSGTQKAELHESLMELGIYEWLHRSALPSHSIRPS